MAYTAATRSLRDGSLVIKDGSGSPKTCTVVCDDGDLRWTSPQEWRRVLCRGTFSHRRPGDDVAKELSFTMKWMQLLGYTANSSDPITPYEIIENVESLFTSTESSSYALSYEFTVADPNPASPSAAEKVVFADVWKTNLECAEGDEYNTLAFSGEFEVAPTITRV